jgi:hypothetical protein
MRAPSGAGRLKLCAAPMGKEDPLTTRWGEVTCEACNALRSLALFRENEWAEPDPGRNGYYDAGGISVLSVIRAKLTPEQFKGFLLGTAIKYALRLNFKGQASGDAEKLADYTHWLNAYFNPGDENE